MGRSLEGRNKASTKITRSSACAEGKQLRTQRSNYFSNEGLATTFPVTCRKCFLHRVKITGRDFECWCAWTALQHDPETKTVQSINLCKAKYRFIAFSGTRCFLRASDRERRFLASFFVAVDKEGSRQKGETAQLKMSWKWIYMHSNAGAWERDNW